MAKSADSVQKEAGGCFKTVLLALGVAIATSVITVWLITATLFPHEFKPVELSAKEQSVLETKIRGLNLGLRAKPARKGAPAASEVLEPQRYSEEGASREVTFSEREVNAMIANNTDLASKFAVDLSPDLVSARLLVPMDPDMLFFGGKTLKMAAGLELRYKRGRPVVILKGMSVWGVPLPNSWLGDLKDIDLVHEFGDEGFWKSFAAGVDNIVVGDGTLTLKLKK